MLRCIVVLALGLLPASAGFAQEASAPSTEKKICRDSVKTGSRLSRQRICKTAREWEESDREAQRDVRSMTTRATDGQAKTRAGGP